MRVPAKDWKNRKALDQNKEVEVLPGPASLSARSITSFKPRLFPCKQIEHCPFFQNNNKLQLTLCLRLNCFAKHERNLNKIFSGLNLVQDGSKVSALEDYNSSSRSHNRAPPILDNEQTN